MSISLHHINVKMIYSTNHSKNILLHNFCLCPLSFFSDTNDLHFTPLAKTQADHVHKGQGKWFPCIHALLKFVRLLTTFREEDKCVGGDLFVTRFEIHYCWIVMTSFLISLDS